MNITCKTESVNVSIEINTDAEAEKALYVMLKTTIKVFGLMLQIIAGSGSLAPIFTSKLNDKLYEFNDQALEILTTIQNGDKTEEDLYLEYFQYLLKNIDDQTQKNIDQQTSDVPDTFLGFIEKMDDLED